MRRPDTNEDVDERRVTAAIHESGHAVLAVMLGRPLASVCIDTCGSGRIVFRPLWMATQKEPRKRDELARIYIAGFAAELLRDSSRAPSGCLDDLWTAWEMTGRSRRDFEDLVKLTVHELRPAWGCVEAFSRELLRVHTLEGAAAERFIRQQLQAASAP